jgi:hypothetical protein
VGSAEVGPTARVPPAARVGAPVPSFRCVLLLSGHLYLPQTIRKKKKKQFQPRQKSLRKSVTNNGKKNQNTGSFFFKKTDRFSVSPGFPLLKKTEKKKKYNKLAPRFCND